MTRAFNQPINCPVCHHEHTQESDFQRWIRNNNRIDSADGFFICDFDFIVHRFITPEKGRSFQCVMFLEVKTRGKKISTSQSKTLSIARQFSSNQNRNLSSVKYVYDGPGGPPRRMRNFGGFLLRLENTSPSNSAWIEWHGKRITEDQLVSLIRFDLNPNTLRPMDWRENHHHPDRTIPLPLALT